MSVKLSPGSGVSWVGGFSSAVNCEPVVFYLNERPRLWPSNSKKMYGCSKQHNAHQNKHRIRQEASHYFKAGDS